MSRTPLTRAPQTTASRMTPQRSAPTYDARRHPSTYPDRSDYGSRYYGDRRWPGTRDRYSYHDRDYYGGHYGRYYGRYPYHYGRYYGPYYRPPYYPYRYGRFGYDYGCYYYGGCYYPSYFYSYPYFIPTFSLGFSYSTYPDVVYASEATVAYPATTVYEQPYYGDAGTTYYGGTTTYQEAPTYSAPSAPAQPPPADATTQPQAKQPDERVLAAVAQGNNSFAAERYGEAKKAYGEAMAIDDTDGVAKLLFGLASFAEGDYDSAATAIRRAMAATPDLVFYPFNVKALYRQESKYHEQMNALAKHVEANPLNRDAQLLLGYLWYAGGDAYNARTVFSSLAAGDPGEPLYSALRDGANQAIEALERQRQQSQQPQQPPALPPAGNP